MVQAQYPAWQTNICGMAVYLSASVRNICEVPLICIYTENLLSGDDAIIIQISLYQLHYIQQVTIMTFVLHQFQVVLKQSID